MGWWTDEGMNKAHTRGRDWGGPKVAGAKLQLNFTLIRTTGLTPRSFSDTATSNFKPKHQAFPFAARAARCPSGIGSGRWNGPSERKLEPHALSVLAFDHEGGVPLRFPCHL
jgi:hypothetical protein